MASPRRLKPLQKKRLALSVLIAAIAIAVGEVIALAMAVASVTVKIIAAVNKNARLLRVLRATHRRIRNGASAKSVASAMNSSAARAMSGPSKRLKKLRLPIKCKMCW